jgi:Domain of unknown function (DUF4260)
MSSGFGPGFQDARSKLFRLEYAAASIAIVGYLVWRSVYLGGVDWLQVIFWVVFPDLASFIPIGASSKRRDWPPWGAKLYNVFHTVLIWAVALAVSWLALGVVYWPLFGWLGHITVDRAVGYTLRA